MKSYGLYPEEPRLRVREHETPTPGPGDVLVRVEATSLNYRDLMISRGEYGKAHEGLIPLSDGAGVVVGTGAHVERWREGDRVAPSFFRSWTDGPFREAYRPSALGGGDTGGVLANFIAVPAKSLVRIPDVLTLEEAATLPCAAVTAWQALIVRGHLTADDTVLVQGTGGVAIFALQIANALGAKVIVTTSSEEKRARAAQLGAWATINYQTTPEWDVEVRNLTGGIGVSHVLELGGPATYERSIRALAAGGNISQIGVLTGWGPQPNLSRLQAINADINGISVGSAEHFAALNEFLVAHQIRPVVDSVFTFDEADAAYEHLASGRHFGKIVIKL